MQILSIIVRDLVRDGTLAGYANAAEKRMHGHPDGLPSDFYLVLPLAHLLGGATELAYRKITPR
jgi:hypothetical protein